MSIEVLTYDCGVFIVSLMKKQQACWYVWYRVFLRNVVYCLPFFFFLHCIISGEEGAHQADLLNFFSSASHIARIENKSIITIFFTRIDKAAVFVHQCHVDWKRCCWECKLLSYVHIKTQTSQASLGTHDVQCSPNLTPAGDYTFLKSFAIFLVLPTELSEVLTPRSLPTLKNTFQLLQWPILC